MGRDPTLTEPTVVARDNDSGNDVRVPLSDYRAGVEAGKYAPGASSVVVEAGGKTTQAASDAARSSAAGAAVAPVSEQAGEDVRTAQRGALDTLGDKAFTLAEGAVDALSLGLIHEHGDFAELRREVNSGSAMVGQLLGTAVGLKLPGPVQWVGHGGEAAGKAAARAVTTSPMLTRGLSEAGLGAALAGAGSVGYQISDAVIEDKPFSAEAVLHEMKIGGLLGFGIGSVAGAMSGRVASRSAVEAQGGLLDPTSGASKSAAEHLHDAIGAMDQAVEEHAARVTMLRHLADEGHIPELGLPDAESALADARHARSVVGDVSERFATSDAAEQLKFRNAIDDYQLKTARLDEAASPKPWQARRAQQLRQVRAQQVPGFGIGPVEDAGGMTDMGAEVERRMGAGQGADHPFETATPAEVAGQDARMAYERNFGRRWEPTPEGLKPAPEAVEVSGGGATPVDAGIENAHAHAGDAEATNPGARRRGRAAPEVDTRRSAGELPPGAEGPRQMEGYVPERANMRLGGPPRPAPFEPRPFDRAEFGAGGAQPPQGAAVMDRGGGAGWSNLGSAAENTGAQISPHTQGILKARPITPQAEAGNLLHGEVGEQLHALDTGHMMPSRTVDEVGGLFRDFKDRLAAEDTRVRSARKAASLASNRAEGFRAGPPDDTVKQGGGLDDLNAALGAPKGDVYGPAEAQGAKPVTPGQDAVDRYLNDWYKTSEKLGPTQSPGDRAAVEIDRAVHDLYRATNGRADAVAATDLAGKYGLDGPNAAKTPLGQRMDQLFLLRKSADLATGTGPSTARAAAAKAAKALLGAAFGHKVAGLVGLAAGGSAALTGRIGAASGRLTGLISEVGAKMLRPGIPGAVASSAVASNRPVAYSDKGPIHDPVQRILELKRVAASPDMIRRQISDTLGDLTITAPTLANHVVESTVHQITALALKAPAIYFNRFGDPYPPSAGDLRKFLEAENTVHDLERALRDAASGAVTRVQAETIRDAFPAVHSRLAAELMNDPKTVANLSEVRMRAAQMVLGVGLTPGADPGFQARQQWTWALQNTKNPAAGGGGKPQALKIRSETSPTPAASTSPNLGQ